MPEEQREVLDSSELEPAPETLEIASIRRRLDDAAERARMVQQTCSGQDPHLGLATTEELIEELHARMVVSRANGEPMKLDYRTVDGGSDIVLAATGERLPEEQAAELLSVANRLKTSFQSSGWSFPADLPEAAWGLIANAWGGNWEDANPEWRAAATRWRDAYHATLAMKIRDEDPSREVQC